jgi:hypothetical protein
MAHEFSSLDIYPSDSYAIYSLSTLNILSTGSLSVARYKMSPASLVNYAIFAGGRDLNQEHDIVDIFDVTSGLWSVSSLSVPRSHMAACVDQQKLLSYFAGGLKSDSPTGSVDVFRHQNISFPTRLELAVPRHSLSCITNREFVYFAGGVALNGPSSVIEIYNSNNHSWMVTHLRSARHSISVILVGANIYFAGGSLSNDPTSPLESAAIDVFDAVSQNWTYNSLSLPRSSLSAHIVDNKLVFAGGYNVGVSSSQVDVLDLSSNIWTTTSMKSARADAASVSTEKLLIFYSGAVTIFSTFLVTIGQH